MQQTLVSLALVMGAEPLIAAQPAEQAWVIQITPANPATAAQPNPADKMTPADLAAMYKSIYASIPFNRVEYDVNPNYRHDTAIEMLFGQMRPTVVQRGNMLAPPSNPRSEAASPFWPYTLPPRDAYYGGPYNLAFGYEGRRLSGPYYGPAAVGLSWNANINNTGVGLGEGGFRVPFGSSLFSGFGPFGFGGFRAAPGFQSFRPAVVGGP